MKLDNNRATMIRAILFYSLLLVIMSSSCEINHEYAPQSRDGESYFGVDYHFSPPFSYWDDNPAIPYEICLGDFYWSEPGIYEFEYFVNSFDYWYGNYTLYQNYGFADAPYSEPGMDGIDTYHTLFCDPNGWHEDRFDNKENVKVHRDKDHLVVDIQKNGTRFQMEMFKTDIISRPSIRLPKWKFVSLVNGESQGL